MLKKLPKLEYLNGLAIDRDEIEGAGRELEREGNQSSSEEEVVASAHKGEGNNILRSKSSKLKMRMSISLRHLAVSLMTMMMIGIMDIRIIRLKINIKGCLPGLLFY